MHCGLLMSTAEKEERHARLHDIVTTHTSHTWASMLVKMLLGAMDGQHMARQTPALSVQTMLERYTNAKKRLYFLDYDVCACVVVGNLRLH